MLEHIKNQFKFCPFCGMEKSLISKKNMLKCLKCSKNYIISESAATGAFIETKDGIVLVRRKNEPKKGMLNMPGGFIEPNEKAENAISRELMEELNFSPPNLRFLSTITNDYIYENTIYITLDLYFYSLLKDTPKMEAGDDATEIVIVKRENIDFNLLAFESSKNIMRYYLNSIKYDIY